MKPLKILLIMLLSVFSISFAMAQNNISAITSNYFDVKDALAMGNGAGAQIIAKNLLIALSAPERLKPDQQKIFNSYIDKLKYDSRHMSETTDIEHQREHFASLSKNLFEVLKGLKMNTWTIYMQYCPVKKAYWLSESPVIENPYYNDKKMATCGKTAAILPAAK